MKINAYKIRLTVAGIVGFLSVLAVCGLFYPVKFLNLQFTALLQRTVFDFSIITAVLLAVIVLVTLFFGRFYCSTLCPFGIFQEFAAFLRGKKKNEKRGNYGVKYLIAGLTFGALLGGSTLFVRYADPYTVFGSAVSLSIFGIIFAIAVLILVIFKNRYFCTNICPVGAILGIFSKNSLNKIYMNDDCIKCGMCAKNCPAGCINHNEKLSIMKFA